MGWFLFIGSWTAFIIFCNIATGYYVPLPPEPLKEKFVITTYEDGFCMNTETLTSRLIRTVESVKIDQI